MRILVDENVPTQTVQMLREGGHDVRDVRGTEDEGISDDGLWQIAIRERRVLVTTDRGFALRRHEPHYGVLLVCLRQPNRQRIHARIREGLQLVAEPDWPGLLLSMRDQVHSLWRESQPAQGV